MPIYVFYCHSCNMLFNFLARAPNVSRVPACPKCGGKRMQRRVSRFSSPRRTIPAGGESEPDFPIDEQRMERAVMELADAAERLDENDPRQAARLMRSFTRDTGLQLGDKVEAALSRMEAGEDPDRIEEEMGDLLDEDETPFVQPERRTGASVKRRRAQAPPLEDPTLYDL